MAHIGSFIPCQEAEISIVDQICARISAVETCAVPQSSFQLDLTQMAAILLRCTSRSLVLIDEFGKGTSPASGIAILGAAIKKLAAVGCKTVCTTHFLELFSMGVIKDGMDGIKARRMTIHLPRGNEDNAAPLFKLEDGVASSSAGLICAKKAGVQPKIIARAKEIIQTMRDRRPIEPLKEAMPEGADLGQSEAHMLNFFFSVESWENATEDQIRILIQKLSHVEV
jgi:DNA mismatch repair protein MSH5